MKVYKVKILEAFNELGKHFENNQTVDFTQMELDRLLQSAPGYFEVLEEYNKKQVNEIASVLIRSNYEK